RVLRDLFYVHAALGRYDEGNAADRTIHQQREVKLAVYVGAVLDVEAVDLLAGGAGLLGHQRVAKHFIDVGDHLGNGLRQTHAALGVAPEFLELALAAAAGVDLALYHIQGTRQLLRRGFRFFLVPDGDAVGHWQPVALEHLLGLIFVYVHDCRPLLAPELRLLLAELRRDADAGLGQALHRGYRLVEHLLFGLVEIELQDPLHAAGPDHDRDADIGVLHAILATKIGRAGQHPLLVLQIALGHGNGGRSRRVVGGTGLQQADDLAAPLAGALDNGVEPLFRRPAHLDQIGQRNAGDGRVAHHRNHVVAVPAERQGRHVLDRDLELFSQEVAEASRVEHPGH